MARRTGTLDASAEQAAALERILDAGSHTSRYRPGPACGVAKVLDALPAATADRVRAELDDEENSSAALADMLIKVGFDVSAFTVARHRRRGHASGCRCPR